MPSEQLVDLYRRLAHNIAQEYTIGKFATMLEEDIVDAIAGAVKESIAYHIDQDQARREIPGRILTEKQLHNLRDLYAGSNLEIVAIRGPHHISGVEEQWTIWVKNGPIQQSVERFESLSSRREDIITLAPTAVRQLLACNAFLEGLVADLQHEYTNKTAELFAGIDVGIEAVAIMLETHGIHALCGGAMSAKTFIERIRALKHSAEYPRIQSGLPPNRPEEPSCPNYEGHHDTPYETEPIDYTYD